MTTRFVSLTDLGRQYVESYQRVGWFLLQALEREHALNVKALLASPPSTLFTGWLRALHAARALQPLPVGAPAASPTVSRRSQ
jgi:hypothetical protein